MTFSLSIFLYIYFAFIAFWGVLSLIGFYHLVRFGGRMIGSFVLGVFYLGGSILLLFASYYYLSPIDWQTELTVFEGLSNLNANLGAPNFFE